MSISFTLKLIITLILGQTLFFKFSAAPESVHIFSALHLEPYGRLGAGFAELLACILLWIPRYKLVGAALSFFLMLNAMLLHLFILGISVQHDHGILFIMATIAGIASGILVYRTRKQL
jgi:hypothetical protein